MLINLQTLIDEKKCYETLRQLRWPEGVSCPKCNSQRIVKRGFDELNKDDAQQMTAQLRLGIVEKKPEVILSGEVECDELYLVAGFKGQPDQVRKRGDLAVQGG